MLDASVAPTVLIADPLPEGAMKMARARAQVDIQGE
jgi:hypothetical protein